MSLLKKETYAKLDAILRDIPVNRKKLKYEELSVEQINIWLDILSCVKSDAYNTGYKKALEELSLDV